MYLPVLCKPQGWPLDVTVHYRRFCTHKTNHSRACALQVLLGLALLSSSLRLLKMRICIISLTSHFNTQVTLT